MGDPSDGINAPDASAGPDGFVVLMREVGLPQDVAAGAQVRLVLPGLEPQDAVVDYVAPNFVGLRTDDAMYRLFGRNAWGWPIGVSGHLFGEGADAARVRTAWESLRGGAYAVV